MISTDTPNARQASIRATATFALAVAALSFAGPLSKRTGLDPVQVVAWRGLLAGTILTTAIAWRVRRQSRMVVIDRRRALHAAESGVWFLLFTSFWTASFPYISVGVSVVIVSSSVFMTFVVTSVRRRDLDLRGGLGCVLALLAVVPSLVGEQSQGRHDVWMGVAFAVLGAIFGTAYYLSLDRSRSTALPADMHWAIASLTAGAIGTVWTMAHDGMFTGVSLSVFEILLALALVPHLLGQGLLVGVAAGGRTVLSNMAVVGEAVGSALIAAVWFDEPLSFTLALAILLFLAGAVLLTGSRSNQGTADARGGAGREAAE